MEPLPKARIDLDLSSRPDLDIGLVVYETFWNYLQGFMVCNKTEDSKKSWNPSEIVSDYLLLHLLHSFGGHYKGDCDLGPLAPKKVPTQGLAQIAKSKGRDRAHQQGELPLVLAYLIHFDPFWVIFLVDLHHDKRVLDNSALRWMILSDHSRLNSLRMSHVW